MAKDVLLSKIEDPAIIYELLMGHKETHSDVFIWKMIGGTEFLCHVRIESVSKSRKDFSIIPVDDHEMEAQNLLMNQSYIDFYIPDSHLLFRCQLKTNFAPVRYSFHLPQEISQVDRRSTQRISTYEDSDLQISFSSQNERGQNQQFSKPCFDLSGGGLSFYISRMEKKFFREGEVLKEVSISTPGGCSKVKAEMILVKEIEPNEFNGLPYRVWRVCCRFKEIDESSKHLLDKFILEKIKGELHVINA
ncbi:MAG TPA: hypothetical protein VKY27_09050 [Bacteriovoracaceae bacterium]|nr:hypothetical protein [Bacteriovoracaceae bacterium]